MVRITRWPLDIQRVHDVPKLCVLLHTAKYNMSIGNCSNNSDSTQHTKTFLSLLLAKALIAFETQWESSRSLATCDED